jgi:disulfide bond formation protein DsbB
VIARALGLVVTAPAAAPGAAWACSACLSSPYGDRSYNIALLGLVLAPFVLGVAFALVFACLAWRRRRARATADSPLHLTTAEERT